MKLSKLIFVFATATTRLQLGGPGVSIANAQTPTPDDETVFVADVNNVVHQISDGEAFPKFTIGGTNFRDLIVTDNLNFIIANHTQNGTILLSDEGGASAVISGAIPFPEGLDIGPDGAVYVSTDADNRVYKLVRSYLNCPVLGPGCPNGGYVMDEGFSLAVEGAQLVADVAVVWSDPTGAVSSGDILVAVASPASIRRFAPDGSSLGSLDVDFGGERPSAMAFGPNGSILVTTEEGSIWQLSTTGGAAITRIGGRARGIAFGIKNDAPVAFVSVDPGAVHSYPFESGQIQNNPTVITSFNNPRGLSFAGAGGAALAGGSDVTVLTPAGHTTYEFVPQDGGQADAECYLFVDSGERPLALSTVSALPQFLREQFTENDVIIPENVQCFVPNGGTGPLCRLCITKTTADVEGIKEIASEEDEWLNRGLGCPLEGWQGADMHANSFYAPEVAKSEYPIIDWSGGTRVVQNVTEGCGSDTLWSRGRGSLVLLSAVDTLPRSVLASKNIGLLDKAIASTSSQAVGGISDFITSKKLRNSLRTTLRSAKNAVSRGRYADVVTLMTRMLADVDAAASTDFKEAGSVQVPFNGLLVSSPDVRAELKVRAAAIRFQACTQIMTAPGASLPADCEALLPQH